MKASHDRLRREMLVLTHKVERIARGYNDDPPEIQGVRQYIRLAWGQIEEAMPMIQNTMNAMHGGQE